MDSGSTLKQLLLHQSWNLESSWVPFRGREQEPVYSALAGTEITAVPCKTNEHLFVPVWRVCSPLFSSARGTFALACAIPAGHCLQHRAGMGKTQSTACASPACRKKGLFWWKTSAVQWWHLCCRTKYRLTTSQKKIKLWVTWKNNKKLNWTPCWPAIFVG